MSLKLPDPQALRDALGMILDDACPLQPAATPIDLAARPGTVRGALLLDDDGEPQGAVLADVAATVYLGGSLIMIPAGAQQDQVAADAPAEAVLDAMAEVVNILRGSINAVPGNPHVSPGPLSSLPELTAAHPWLVEPTARLDLAGPLPCGEGCLVVLAR